MNAATLNHWDLLKLPVTVAENRLADHNPVLLRRYCMHLLIVCERDKIRPTFATDSQKAEALKITVLELN